MLRNTIIRSSSLNAEGPTDHTGNGAAGKPGARKFGRIRLSLVLACHPRTGRLGNRQIKQHFSEIHKARLNTGILLGSNERSLISEFFPETFPEAFRGIGVAAFAIKMYWRPKGTLVSFGTHRTVGSTTHSWENDSGNTISNELRHEKGRQAAWEPCKRSRSTSPARRRDEENDSPKPR